MSQARGGPSQEGCRLAFLACVEAGALEQKTALLVRSLRQWGGRFADAPFYAFRPRGGQELAPDTRALFDEAGVTYCTDRVNGRFAEFGLANKIFACAHAEEIAAEDVLVFLDSDSIITSEPAELDLGEGIDAAIRPVDFGAPGAEGDYREGSDYWRTHFRRPCSGGPGHPFDDYWLRLYDLCGLGDPEWYVVATCDRVRIRAWFNSGLVATRRSAGLFCRWRDDFERIVAAGLFPPDGRIHYVEQLALATALTPVRHRVETLDGRYNYPLAGRQRLPLRYREAQLDQLVHVHYNRYFQVPGYLRSIEPPLDSRSPVGCWLETQLPLFPLVAAGPVASPLFDDADVTGGARCN